MGVSPHVSKEKGYSEAGKTYFSTFPPHTVL